MKGVGSMTRSSGMMLATGMAFSINTSMASGASSLA
eukprot:CAMPEP_0195118386 /NCGR_PEP_ID=MMETSP0448-20130528/116883_1 /TAXON_ID=66468 /ORGANISM="Heterocapsa triquestra, Strain CCMP 448" /LENGTH=35 /DNA_ID= /DNA_START= /DNA_END= /DNA_ORIENTATION=